eukprot:15365696-Ditylum_brightwellii.AAC.1
MEESNETLDRKRYTLSTAWTVWTPIGKTSPGKVMTTEGTLTWQGTYYYGITDEIIHRKPATMYEYTSALEKSEQEIIDNVEPSVPLDKLIAFIQQGQCLIATDGSACEKLLM